MTTRQHLIEQDCMDKLKWSVEQVAYANEDEMMSALLKWETSRVLPSSSHVSDPIPIPVPVPVQVSPRLPDSVSSSLLLDPMSSRHLNPMTSRHLENPDTDDPIRTEIDIDFHKNMILKLRSIKKLKEDYVTWTDAIPEDSIRFRDSIKKDQYRLEQSIEFVTSALNTLRNDIQKKQYVHGLLRKVMGTNGGSDHDTIHLEHVESQLVLLESYKISLEDILK
jgi:hypothetical protein